MTHFFSAAPARRLQIGDAKVRTGVRRRSGCVTGAGGEASKARNAEVCLRAGWRMRRPASHPPASAPLYKRSACGQGGLRFFSRYSGGGYSRKKARPHRPYAVADAPERRAEVADSRRTRTGLRALCRGYPSNCCPQTDADSRLRGAGQIRICQSRVRHGYARFGDNVGAYPAVRPAGPCR